MAASIAIAEKIRALLSGPRTHVNLPVAQLVQISLLQGESRLAANGALVVYTGTRTGRSPNDRFIVDDLTTHAQVDWGRVNRPFPSDRFEQLLQRVCAYLQERSLFIQDLYSGADPLYRLPLRVISEYAWHALFARQLFVRPHEEQLATHAPAFTLITAPEFEALPERDGTGSRAFILLDLTRRIVLIGGTKYAGEMKKSIFSVMNFLLPQRDVLSMHCSANVGADGQSALFFGLSGTGKTTLSADTARRLIGDDEHGWSATGIFNLEGGCYAKCIGLSEEREPQIYGALRFGSVLENVVLNRASCAPDYADNRFTENTRAAYPIDHIDGAMKAGMAGHPRNVMFLTADAFGVLPPIARLSPEQAMYHFLSGYTAKLAGTETGMGKDPVPEFSACFGAPFLPLPPSTYARMLGERIRQHKVNCWLVNTGWSGGRYGVGQRMSIGISRALVSSALNGELDKIEFVTEPAFGLSVPMHCAHVPDEVLSPRNVWADKAAYDRTAAELALRFEHNFLQFESPELAREGGFQHQR